ncbi:MAG: hypothetical protein OYH77_05640, partial [Pseudomonadota bacterium]|nr:hypothetical protein [Pseudomonadota bacterium]
MLIFLILTGMSLIQCEAQPVDDVETDTTSPSPTCSAAGFTKIQASIDDICAGCHDHAKGSLTDAFTSDQAHNVALLTAAGYKNGKKLYDYIMSDAHTGQSNVADEVEADYTAWCV